MAPLLKMFAFAGIMAIASAASVQKADDKPESRLDPISSLIISGVSACVSSTTCVDTVADTLGSIWEGISNFFSPEAAADPTVASASGGEDEITFSMYSGVVQDGHNDLKVFFQKGGQYQKNQKVPGDKNAAEQCAKLCAGLSWCKSFDIQKARGECSLSKTVMGEGGPEKVDPAADYYEKN